TGQRSVTWAEFVESGLLRQYRRVEKVNMAEIRAFIDLLRERYETPYPLAHYQPFVADRRRVLEAQDTVGLSADFALVAQVSGQLILTPASDQFVSRVEWADDIAVQWRPHDDPRSPVRMNPVMRFGRPATKGISTEALWEHVDAGEPEDQ